MHLMTSLPGTIAGRLATLAPSELAYIVTLLGLVGTSFVLIRRPFANLAIAACCLGMANTAVLGETASAMLAAVIIANVVIGTLVRGNVRRSVRGPIEVLAVMLAAFGLWAAIHGFALGNRPAWIVGDLYQTLEFAALLILGRRLVTTEHQFRVLVMCIVGSIALLSVFQILDALMGATYMAEVKVKNGNVDSGQRLINMHAPIAFVALIALAPRARVKWPVLALAAFFETMLILSFTRGLWLASAISIVVLFFLVPVRERAAVAGLAGAAAVMAVGVLYTFGLQTIVVERARFAVRQVRDMATLERPAPAPEVRAAPKQDSGPARTPAMAPEAPTAPNHESGPGRTLAVAPPAEPPPLRAPAPVPIPVLAQRRRLEHASILPEIARRPLAGNGLGATYRLPGEAVLHGPKGQIVNNHYVHDLYIQIPFRLGVPALVVFLGLMVAYFREAIRDLRTSAYARDTTALVAGLIAVMAGEIVLNVTSSTFLTHPTGGMLGLTMAMTATGLSVAARGSQPGARPGGPGREGPAQSSAQTEAI
jgi:hypothetical protein